jgi:hypothetical protein
MRKIYENADFTRVGYFQSILEEAGIPTFLKNLGASMGMGEIPFVEVYPELWIVNDVDYERAIDVLEPYYQHEAEAANAPEWICSACGVEVDGGFDECWKCGAMKSLPSSKES